MNLIIKGFCMGEGSIHMNDFAFIRNHHCKISTQIIDCIIIAPCDFLKLTLSHTIHSML